MGVRASIRLLFLVFSLMGFLSFPQCVQAADTGGRADTDVRILILPFQVNARSESAYLGQQIPQVLGDYLRDEGAQLLETPPLTVPPEELTTTEIRRLAAAAGADQVIAGSYTRIGDDFSLDAHLYDTANPLGEASFFAEGRGIENLLGKVRDLGSQISNHLFDRELVVDLRIAGNKRIESDAIRKVIQTKVGDVYNPKSVSEDIKAIFALGYFADIRVDAQETPQGRSLTYTVQERPTIRQIRVSGNHVYDDEEVLSNLDIKTGSIFNIYKVKSNIQQIESLYKEKNYHNVQVDYKVHELTNNQADVEFLITEGKKVRIKTITFEGNVAYDAKKLRKLIKTKEKGFFSWLTSSGELNRDDLNQDAAKLAAFYQNHGYIEARVGDPVVDVEEDWIYITFKIEEGPQFRVGTVDIQGDLVLPRAELMEKLKIRKEEFYNREVIRNDILLLTDIYSDEGYAYADISPKVDEDKDNLVVNITYTVHKGSQVYFEKIIISGNTKTRDKVIRRQLRVYEQELFSGKGLKRGVRNLYRLDYFEDVKVNTVKGSDDDKMVLKLDVTEKPTGTFSFGAGYSTVEKFFTMASVSQRNLFGRGQTLSLKGEFGAKTNRYTLSFTEPWLFDIPLSAGFDIYNSDRNYDTYRRESWGGRLRFGYPVFDYTRVYLTYGYDLSNIYDVDEADASDNIIDLKGTNVTSSVINTLRYDSRDRAFNPTEGGDHSISVEYAGLGGNIGFTKYLAETGFYMPLYKELIGFVHGKGGYVYENEGKDLPDYERFYLGGINSLRGFGWRDISPTTINDEGEKVQIGGTKMVQFNAEIIVPLVKKAGLMGVLFFDTGDAYGPHENIDLFDLRESAGFGIRWYSPIGPMRLENGYILDPREGEKTSGRWEFAIGGAF
ncbi:MAG: outer membrane protein assembly factor BamA [Desulfosarcinaceae bacterium]